MRLRRRNVQLTLDEATDPWGVKVERVEVKDVRLPVQLQRAMAAEAEAAREARAKVRVACGVKIIAPDLSPTMIMTKVENRRLLHGR